MTTRSKRKLGGREATTARIDGDFALSVGKPDRAPPSEWEWRLLTDLARLESGHTPSRKKPEYWGGDIPWIGIRDATANHGRTIYETNEYTNELGIANSAARILPANTVCLSRTASVGYVIVMGRPMATSQDFVNWSCSAELDATFLKYVLMAEGDALLRFASGSVHQTIYFPEVKSFYVAAPPLAKQREITELLGSLDDKIELNRRMNETLEAMAQSIFRDWFVDFGPTRRKLEGAADPIDVMGGLVQDAERAQALADLFPARLGDDGLPEGWRFKPLDKSIVLQRGFDLPKASRTDGAYPVIAASGPSGTHSEFKVAAPGVCTGRSGVLGNVFFVQQDFWPLNTSLWVKEYLNATPIYAYFLLQEIDLQVLNAGSAVPTLNRNHVHSHPTVTPPMNVINAYTQIAESLMTRLDMATKECEVLAATRDLLLPKLMSGEIRLSEAEGLMEAAQ